MAYEDVATQLTRRDALKFGGTALVGAFLLGGCAAQAEPEAAGDAPAEVVDDGPKLPDASYDSSDFVLLSEAIPDLILEIRYHSTYNFVGARVDGYEEPVALLCIAAANALKAASDAALAKGYRLKVFDAYRPQRAVNHFERWAEDIEDTKMKPYFYPDLDKSVLFDQGYIAHRSGHSRGSTVDLTLFEMATGKDVDMGGPFDFFGELSHPSNTVDVTKEQFANRQLLHDIMADAGYGPVDTEWWHFRLEDEPYPDTYFDFPVRTDFRAFGGGA